MKILISLILLIPVYAEINHHKRIDLEKFYKEEGKKPPKEKKSHGPLVIIGNQISTVNINHNEASSTSGFFALGNKSSVKVHSLDIKLGYEIFKDSMFSITPFLSIGKTIGREEETPTLADDTKAEVRDSVNANRYGYGGSLNFNTSLFNEKLQFFLGLFIFNENRKYELIYGRENTSSPSINFETEFDYSISQTSVGFRWFSKDHDVFSQFSLNLETLESSSRVDRFFVNQVEGTFTRSSEFDESSIGLGIGLGMIF